MKYANVPRNKPDIQVKFIKKKERKIMTKLTESQVSNSNWIEWSTIQAVIARVISKSDEREARGRFENTSAITPGIVRHEV